MSKRIFGLLGFCVVLTGCVTTGIGSLPFSPVQPNDATEPHAAYKVLYSFKGGAVGANPFDGLLALNDKLYGTTINGGSGCSGNGCGTAFEANSFGVKKVLYRFKNTPDGSAPFGSLLALHGKLYGTTESGGASNNGTIFEVNTLRAEHVLYSFKGSPDGASPYAGLIFVNGKLYGTTYAGGASGNGTVFEIRTSGKERVLYSFQGGADGAHPYGGLLAVGRKLYGTTTSGGASSNGTVFEISESGKERILHTFGGAPTDGAEPEAGLIVANGKLYGTTYAGGASGLGTVFELSRFGKERVLCGFKGGTDGAQPYGGLLAMGRRLYGTTTSGGSSSNGTVFEITSSGKERVLHRFNGAPTDGSLPQAGLVALDGNLYSTTQNGGTSNNGTIFGFTP